MSLRTGTQFVTLALREIQVLDPTATASGERLDDGIAAACDLLDSWQIDNLTIGATTITPYALVSGTQTYTIGSGGAFNQTYPANGIDLWSVVPDVTAQYPLEIPRGRPLTFVEWQQIRLKTNPGGLPSALYFDNAFTAGLGQISLYPVPNVNNIGVRLYQKYAPVVTLVAATTYNMRPGMTRAFTLGLALELADRYGKGAVVTPRLEARAARALAQLRVSNIQPRQSRIGREWSIGSGNDRRTFNVRTGGSA